MSENRELALLEIGRILHNTRCTKGCKRDEFADPIGITKRFLSAIENGEERPEYETRQNIICCLSTSADQTFYPDLENDTDAHHVMRLYENCDEQDKQLVNAWLNAIKKTNRKRAGELVCSSLPAPRYKE